MGLVLELLKPEIEKTINGLDLRNFEPDPIAGPRGGTDSRVARDLSRSASQRTNFAPSVASAASRTLGGWRSRA